MTGPPKPIADCRVALRRSLAGTAPGALVVVACSGGADSLALADAAAFEAPRAGLRVGLVTVDHGLQEGSADRAKRLRDWAAERGFEPAEVRSVQVGASGGPEAAAREARYAALDAAAEQAGADVVLLGHTRDDQAETVLLGLARGSGARALSGMPASRGRYRRPFLELARATTRAACAAAGLEPWEDPHNHDAAYTRSRLRALLPELERVAPGATVGLARSARLLRDDADLLDSLATSLYRDVCLDVSSDVHAGADVRTDVADGTEVADVADIPDMPDVAIDAVALADAPAALRTRVLHRWVTSLGVPPSSLSSRHIAALDALVTSYVGQGPAMLPGRIAIRRDGHQLRRTP